MKSKRAKAREIPPSQRDAPTMTVTTDEKKRVVIPSARPGDRVDVQMTPEGKVVLTSGISGQARECAIDQKARLHRCLWNPPDYP